MCLTEDYELEKKILHLMGSLYNQRQEFVKLASNLLLIFDDEKVEKFETCKKKIRILNRLVDKSEKWIANLKKSENKLIYDQIIDSLDFFDQIIYIKKEGDDHP
jgi:hypothetical protein